MPTLSAVSEGGLKYGGKGVWKIMVRNYEIWIKQLTESTAWSWVKFVTWGYGPCSFLSFQYCWECSHMEHWASWHLSSDVITDAALQSDTIRSHSFSTWSFIAQVCVESKHKRPFRSSSHQWEIGFDCGVWQFSILTITGTHEIDYSSLAKWARDNSTKFFQMVKCSALWHIRYISSSLTCLVALMLLLCYFYMSLKIVAFKDVFTKLVILTFSWIKK